MYREPLCLQKGVTSRSVMSTTCITSEDITPPSSLILAHEPNHNPLPSFGSPRREVLAGCCQSLLEDGSSRCYLRSPCIGVWTLTSPCPSGALARFFPKAISLTPGLTGSAHGISPQCNFYGGRLSMLQSFLNVQTPILARPPGCTYRLK